MHALIVQTVSVCCLIGLGAARPMEPRPPPVSIDPRAPGSSVRHALPSATPPNTPASSTLSGGFPAGSTRLSQPVVDPEDYYHGFLALLPELRRDNPGRTYSNLRPAEE
ncbi:hypothetical protein PTTG_06241 [Puccinia triticina 1-1 BBBD Race 1]|uniref:Uncharacterized protein n=2 Tax=Puccinia triticina TaxID=208348 RepID=A0A0C4EZI2_PUCT1|nr:uncharacterized protein PtA15_4A737 [Puccinia triticina]OAV93769.1 hypothetical protein PTTG_06241 [Puccinia triticina 1-1 BBBD Race 1]WAQ84284.1 hypothetical protein PtA15_4A737 [Puccinia triticina]WAR55100.1 hypothetical protein PtB15_4B720 [Puccinia triticina]